MRVVYFDYWTVGTRCFVDIDKKLKEQGHDTLFLHTGSFRGKYPKEEMINGIKCHEINHYNTTVIFKALEQIKPDILVGLNTTYILDRAAVMACKKLKIKSFFMMHGEKQLDDQIEDYIKSLEGRNKLKRKISKSLEYSKRIVPNYLYSLYKFNRKKIFNLHFMKVFYSYFKNPANANIRPSYAGELLYDKCLIYSKKYVNYYQQLGYGPDNISIVGVPEYDELFELINLDGFNHKLLPPSVQELLRKDMKFALYLEDGFPEDSMAGWDFEYRNEHLDAIAERLKKEGYFLVVKLHPLAKRDKIQLKSDNVILLEKANLFALTYYAHFCIGHISTTLNIPVILNKPIVLPKWERSGRLPDFFIETKVAFNWNHIDDVLNLSIDTKAREAYMENNITVTTGTSAENIVQLMIG